MQRFACAVSALAVLIVAQTGRADFIQITASQTNTLIQNPSGPSMPGLFSGLAGSKDPSGIHRGLLQFDIVAALPSCAVIESVTLSMYLLSAGNGPSSVGIGLHDGKHKWDQTATWSSPWTTPGGDFSPTVSASQTVGNVVNTTVTWGSTSQMVADVQSWLDNPSTNFGWFVIGDESDAGSVRRFATDPSQVPGAFAPTLAITYEACPTPEPSSAVLLVIGAAVWGFRRKFRGKS